MTREYDPKKEQALAERPPDILSIISKIADGPLDLQKVEVLERMLAMQERVQAQDRKQQFIEAMARLQEKLPQINKDGQAKNSKFARLESIDTVIRPLLAEEGFSIAFDEESHNEKTVTFLMTISHRGGHSEPKRLTVPIDVAARNSQGVGIRPAIQDAGSTVSYARRYLLKMHLNLIETNEDTNGESREPLTDDQAKDLQTLFSDATAKFDIDKRDRARGRFFNLMHVSDWGQILQSDLGKAQTALGEMKRLQK